MKPWLRWTLIVLAAVGGPTGVAYLYRWAPWEVVRADELREKQYELKVDHEALRRALADDSLWRELGNLRHAVDEQGLTSRRIVRFEELNAVLATTPAASPAHREAERRLQNMLRVTIVDPGER